jgi:hypothetical protein
VYNQKRHPIIIFLWYELSRILIIAARLKGISTAEDGDKVVASASEVTGPYSQTKLWNLKFLGKLNMKTAKKEK